MTMHIVRRTFRLASDEELSQSLPSAPSTASLHCLRNYVGSMRPEVMQESESVSCMIDGNSVTLVRGQHFFM